MDASLAKRPSKSSRAHLGKMGSSVASHLSAAAKVPAWRKRISAFVDSSKVTVVMTVMTVYALFGDDFRLAVVSPSHDEVFFMFSFIALLLFTAELLLNSIGKPEYFLRFFFWLDLLATISLIPDIGWLWDPIVGAESTATEGSTGAIQAGRASRAGTKAGRIVRIVRLIRLIRIVKLYKHVKDGQDNLSLPTNPAINRRSSATATATLNTARRASTEPPRRASMAIDEPSLVGKTLSDLTSRRVILLVLAMIIMLPLFDPDAFSGSVNVSQEFGLVTIHKMSFGTSTDSNSLLDNTINQYYNDAGKLIYLQLQGEDQAATRARLESLPSFNANQFYGTTEEIANNYRANEVPLIQVGGCYDAGGEVVAGDDCTSFAYFDTKSDAVYEAVLNIGKTLFVILVLAFASLFFTKDAETLVIQPIERMVGMVKKLAENPLDTIHDPIGMAPSIAKGSGGYETALLERTLSKIGALLQVGFGEAGARIISQNMKKGHGHHGVNPMIPGSKMYGIFGFCDIRQFTDATECLQEQVMMFVNQIGDIVHFATHKYCGAANKNIGDAFLLVWRIPEMDEGDSCTVDAQPTTKGTVSMNKVAPAPLQIAGASRRDTSVTEASASSDDESVADPEDTLAHVKTALADNALYSFLKMIVDIENSNNAGILATYAEHPEIMKRFPTGYRVRMGYGLHYGWAIEGAIGSRFKIDASYLSPNVNISARLEAATKQYGTQLLISGPCVELMSEAARSRCRHIDTVTVKGSNQPIPLYTFDVVHIPKYLGSDENNNQQLDCDFETDSHIPLLQQGLPAQFGIHFKAGVTAYVAGDWPKAKQELETAEEQWNGYGPCHTLLGVMRKTQFAAPRGWQGYRELTEK